MLIDDLYKNNVSNSGDIPPGLGWDNMNRKLKRRLFFQFTPTKFNVYYLLLFISFSGFSTYSGYRSFVMKRENQKNHQHNIHYKSSVDTLNKPAPDSITFDTAKQLNKITPVKIKKNKERFLRKIDTVAIKQAPVPVQQKQVKRIKKTIIVKPTVVEQTDTLKILN